MQIELLVALLIALFILGPREGLVIADKRDGSQKAKNYSSWWHKLGWLNRAFIVLGIFLYVQQYFSYSDWQLYAWPLAGFVLSWPWYNISINLIRKRPILDLSDKGIDGFIKRLLKLKS
jgi:hypothetical protein